MSRINNDEAFAAFLSLEDTSPALRESTEAKHTSERITQAKQEAEIDTTDFDDTEDEFDGVDWMAALEDGFDDDITATPKTKADDSSEESNKEEGDATSSDNPDDTEAVEEEAVDVDLDTLITLPDGRSLTIEELQTGYAEQTALAEQRQQVVDMLSKFEQDKEAAKSMMELSVLECDRTLQGYAQVDLKRLLKENPAAYAQHHAYIQATQEKKAHLIQEMNAIKERQKKDEYEAYVRQCNSCLEVLQHDIPGWNNELYQELMQFAVDSGVSEEDISKENRPSFFKMAYKAYQFEKGISLAKKAKVKRVGAPTKTIGASSQKDSSEKERKIAAFKQGKLSTKEVFDLLED